MKRYEYRQLHDRPLLQLSTPAQFSEWMLKTINRWGAEGWFLVQVTTPQVNNQLTGDLIALGSRELPPDPAELEAAKQAADAGRFPPR